MPAATGGAPSTTVGATGTPDGAVPAPQGPGLTGTAEPRRPAGAETAAPVSEAKPSPDSMPSPRPGQEAKPAQDPKPHQEIKSVSEARIAAPATAGERRAEESAAGVSAPIPAAEPAPVPAPAALPLTTLRQIADAVATGAASLPDPTSVRAGAVAAAWSAAAQADGPVRLLTLQLRPAELGQVLVRMRLQDGRLEMSLRAEREETADLLRRDGGLLSALVREAGYQPDLVTVQAGRLPGQPDAPPQGAPQGGSPSLPSFAGGQQQGGASPDQPTRRTPDAPEEGGRRTMEQRDDAYSGDRDRGGLYL